MSTYTPTVRWSRKGDAEDFGKGRYSRAPLAVIASGAKQSSPFLDCRVTATRLLAMTSSDK